METFNAQQFQPQFGGMAKHPIGMSDFVITNTYGANNKNTPGGQLIVELTSPAGKILVRFNLFNPSAQAVEIANKQLSALCHVVGIFALTFPRGQPTTEEPAGSMENFARELRNGRGRMEVGWQDGQAPTQDNPAGGYVEVKKLFDVNGNEPGKPGAAKPMMQPASPLPQQPPQSNPAWGGQPQQPAPQPPQQGWTNNSPPQQSAPQPNAGWSQAPQQPQGGPTPPPWGQPNR